MTVIFRPPQALRPQDRVAVIAPASGFERGAFDASEPGDGADKPVGDRVEHDEAKDENEIHGTLRSLAAGVGYATAGVVSVA